MARPKLRSCPRLSLDACFVHFPVSRIPKPAKEGARLALGMVRSEATAIAMRVVSCGVLTLLLCSVSVAGYSAGFDQVLLSLRAASASFSIPAVAD